MTTLDLPFGIRQPRTALTRRNVDALLIGGLSILIFAVMFLLVPKNVDISHLSWTMFYLGFVVNGPHFFASYWHIYIDNTSRLREPRFLFAGFAVPLILIIGLAVASRNRSDHTLGLMVGVMYLSVGWHYVKQIYGVILVSSAAHGKSVSGVAKKLLRINLLLVWFMSWTFANEGSWTTAKENGFFGVSYSSANIRQFLRDHGMRFFASHFRLAVYLLVGLSAAFALLAFVRQWIRTGATMAPVGWVAWASIYVWYLPVLYHPAYFYLVPFFHSLQYLLFSVTFSWNKARSESAIDAPLVVSAAVPGVAPGVVPSSVEVAESLEITDSKLAIAPVDPVDPLAIARRRRQQFVQRFGLFVLFTFVLGAAGFHWIPEWMDRNMNYRSAALGGQFWVVAFNVFINVHHYFVDSVIWRGTNPQVRKFLQPRPVRAS
jgi:hypothetical protein